MNNEYLKLTDNLINDLPIVCVQGIGFVGSAMAVAVADERKKNGNPYFNVIGVDLETPEGRVRIDALNSGKFPFKIVDKKLLKALRTAHEQGNLIATSDEQVYSMASVVLVDVHLDIEDVNNNPSVDFEGFKKAIRTLGRRMKPGSLIIIETTVPPGTCEKIVAPELESCLIERGLPGNSILVAHSYERVMPGKEYYDSIINFWRVYSGLTPQAADACEDFLSKIINIGDYPLTRLHSATASEMAKVLENSYRAMNIAFIEEWSRFAESAGVDLFEVIEAIRMRPTHNNIRQPGFGVGGYCLTKDPLFAPIAAKTILGFDYLEFPFSIQALKINNQMPLGSLEKIETMLDGSVKGKSILLLGISYRPDVGDTRHSPSQVFAENARKRGAEIVCHDPLVQYWQELDMEVPRNIPLAKNFDAIVFAVSHKQYSELNLEEWLSGNRPCILDANGVLTQSQREFLKNTDICFESVGRGKQY